MKNLVVRIGFRVVLLALLAAIPAAGLVMLLAMGRNPFEALAYAALMGMVGLASAWAGGLLFISRSIKVLLAATRRIVGGDFTARVDFAHASAEVRRLGQLFNEVAQALERHVTAAQRQAEEMGAQARALREKARLLDLAHDAILVRGMDGVITYWNRAAEELYGWPAAEAVGSAAPALLRYESSTLEQIEQALLQEGRWEGELTHVAREGIPIWVSSRCTLERDDQGLPLRILELNSNIGDRKRAEQVIHAVTCDLERRVLGRTEELARINQRLQGEIDERARTVEELHKAIEVAKAATQAKSGFLANMSHEIRTPLNGVTGMIGLLLNTPLSPQQLKYTTIARTAAESLLALISDILDFSKLEASGVELEAAAFAPREVVETLLEIFAPRAAQKGLELACHFQKELPDLVLGDAHRLRQVLNNLLSNAIKFTSKGRVAVRATVERQINTHIMIGFEVSDTGIGISPQGRDRLFQPFSQADSSISRSFGGTGLGLAISRGLVELMGGQIEVQSELGTGSTFHFTLVLEKVGAAGSTFSWRTVADGVRNLRALVVARNEVSRDIIREHLSNWTIAVGTAPDSAAAMGLLRRAAGAGEPYRLIILDLQFDRTEALQFAQTIKGGEFADAILLAVLPLDDSVDAARWRTLGFAGTVTKPLLPSRLLDAITDAVAPPDGKAPRRAISNNTGRVFEANGIRVLLAEDNEVNQLVATEILAAAGFCCDVVATGRAALEAVFRKNYDLVLMDCQMPDMDGMEATRSIRQKEALQAGPAAADGACPRRVPILAVTANATKADREQALAAGMDGYLTKPIEPRRLIEAIWSFFPERAEGKASPDEVVAAPSPAMPWADEPIASPPPMDLNALLARCLNKTELVRRLLSKFEEHAMRDVEEISQSISAGDLDRATRASHGLKGVAASMSAASINRIAAEIEVLLRAADTQGAIALLEPLRAEARRCVECIPQLQARLPGAQAAPPLHGLGNN